MKVIHTSDWHIGRTFERESLAADQRAFLDWLAGVVADQGVDLVVIAGDIYDRSVPSEEAVALLDDGLDALVKAGAQVALISGNHDGATRLGFGAGRQAGGGVHVFADTRTPPEPWICSVGDERLIVLPVPYLDPLTAAPPLPAPDGTHRPRTHANVLADAFEHGRTQVEHARASLGTPTSAVAVAHAYVVGAQPSDSERTLTIGGSDQVEASVFAGFDYVALGHLHRPQQVGGDETIVYSGSPLPYSFSEDHPKSVRLLDIGAEGVRSSVEIPIPVGRAVTTITGTLDELLSGRHDVDDTDCWVAVRLTDRIYQTQPLERLRTVFPHIVSLRYTGIDRGTDRLGADGDEVGQRPPDEVILDFLDEMLQGGVTATGRDLVLDALATAVRESDR